VGQLSPIAALISHLSSGLLLAGRPRYSPKGPFISAALDSADSVRCAKLQRFEGPRNFNKIWLWAGSRTGESIRI
jgi:hypothetical protein